MSGVKNRKGKCNHRYWIDSSSGERLTRVMVVEGGKKRMVWALKIEDGYKTIPERRCILS